MADSWDYFTAKPSTSSSAPKASSPSAAPKSSWDYFAGTSTPSPSPSRAPEKTATPSATFTVPNKPQKSSGSLFDGLSNLFSSIGSSIKSAAATVIPQLRPDQQTNVPTATAPAQTSVKDIIGDKSLKSTPANQPKQVDVKTQQSPNSASINQTPDIIQSRQSVINVFDSVNSALHTSPIDSGIKAAQDYLSNYDNRSVTQALASAQKVVAPAFKNQVTGGIIKGVSDTYLASSKSITETFNRELPQPVSQGDKVARTVGEAVGSALAFIAGGEVLKGLGFTKLTLPALFAITGQTGASYDTTIQQRLAKAPVDLLAGWLTTYVPVAKKFFSADLLRGTVEQGAVNFGQSFINNLVQGMPIREANEVAQRMALVGALFHVGGSATGLLHSKLLESSTKTAGIEMTPEQARSQVEGTNIKGTKFGEVIEKAAAQAEAEGKNIRVTGEATKKSTVAKVIKAQTPEGISVNIEFVEPKKIQLLNEDGAPASKPGAPAEEGTIVQPTEQSSEKTSPIAISYEKEAKGYTSAADFADAVFSVPKEAKIGTVDPMTIEPRDATDASVVNQYKARIQAGERIEPIMATSENGKIGTTDGSNRTKAYQELGQPAPIILTKGSAPGLKTIEELYTEARNHQPQPDNKPSETVTPPTKSTPEGKLPQELQPLVERAKSMTRVQFLKEFKDGIKSIDPTTQDTALKAFSLIKSSGLSLEEFYQKAIGKAPDVKTATATPEPPARSKSIRLQAGIDPGLDKFFGQDIKPVVDAAKESAKEIRGLFTPYATSENAKVTTNAVREAKAEIANLSTIEYEKYKDTEKHFSKFKDAENIASISQFERTGEFSTGPQGYGDFYKKSMAASWKILKEVHGKDNLGYIENYVRRMYKFDSAEDEQKGVAYLGNSSRSLSENKSVYKQRVLDMPLDEALQNMQDRGIKVKMVTSNPETLRQWSVVNAQRALSYADMWNQFKKQKLIVFVKQSAKVPDDMVKLNDRAAQVFYPADEGIGTAGTYYADVNVARVLNNTISAGLEGSPTIKGLRVISNVMNQFQLGLSAFHFTGTAINASVSDVALGLRDILHGKLVTGVKEVGRATVPFASFMRDMFNGRAFIEDLKNNSPEAYKVLEEKFNPGGARLGIDQRYQTKMWDTMIHAFTEGNYVGGIVRIPGSIIEKVAQPLLEYAIPRVKVGAYLDLAGHILELLPEDHSTETRRRVLAKAWDSIDNRFGQLVYDNLMWKKTFKDVALLATRSVGWNLGTIREIGGAATDIPNVAKGKGVSDRILYSLSLALVVGLYGAIYQYLHTGRGPQELKDYFAPKDGTKDKNGNDVRRFLPSYIKDVYAYSQDAVSTVLHKQSPIIATMLELSQNKDYYGDLIRNTDDPWGVQLNQLGQYMLRNVLPFSIQQVFQQQSQGASVEQKVESFFGITQAPANLIKSDVQKSLELKMRQQRGLPGPRTPEQKDSQTLKTQAKEEVKKGNFKGAYKELIDNGTLNTAKKRALFLKDARLNSNQRMLKMVPKKDRSKFKLNQ